MTGVLGAWNRAACIDDVRLVVTELVANAVVHAGGEIALQLRVEPDRVRCAVTDAADARVVAPRGSDAAAPGGRGLYLVERSSDRWGVERGPRGKTVWAEWTRPPSAR